MKEMLLALLLLIIGFVLLIKGADFFVDGSSSVAKRLKVPSMIIGLTIVAMGTSLPECAVSVTASLNNNNALAVSNVIGSNIFNILLVLGLAATINPMGVTLVSLIDIIFMVLITLLLFMMIRKDNSLVKKQGIILVIIYTIYMIYTIIR